MEKHYVDVNSVNFVIGNNIKRIREATIIDGRKMTIEKLAEKADVSISSVKRAEKGENIYVTTFLAIARALEVTLDELLSD